MKIPLIKTCKFKILLLAVGAGFVPLIVIILAAGPFSLHLKRDFPRSLEEIKVREGHRLKEQKTVPINGQLHQTALEGQNPAKVSQCSHPANFLDRFPEKKYWRSRLWACETGPNSDQEIGYLASLAPVSVRPPGGPELMGGAWADLVKLDQSIALLDTRMRQFRQGIVVFLGGVGLLGLLTGLYLTRRQAREMAALTRAAEAYNAGDLDYRICQPAEDELGELAHTLHRMAASLKENTVSRLEWENTFDVIPDQIMVLNGDQRVKRLNRAAAAYMGVSPQEALGRPCYELMHQTPGPPDFCPHGRAIKEGVRSHLEYCAEDKGLTLLVTVDPLRNAAGEIVGTVHVARDITPLKQMQQEMARNSQFLNKVIETTPVAVGVVNRQGLFTQVNLQFFQEYGYTPENILGKHFSVLYADESEMRQVLKELREQGEVLSRRGLFRHKNGQTVPTRFSIRKLWGADGELLGSVAVGKNISEETSLQRQLEQAQKMEAIANLAGGLAHNFNNLLMTIMGLTILISPKSSPATPFIRT